MRKRAEAPGQIRCIAGQAHGRSGCSNMIRIENGGMAVVRRHLAAVMMCAAGIGMYVSGCGAVGGNGQMTEPVGTETAASTSGVAARVAVETNQSVEFVTVSRTYYMQVRNTDGNEDEDADRTTDGTADGTTDGTTDGLALVPSLSLFDDGTFGFSYDVLSSYLTYGTYETEGDRLTAVTSDGKYHYVFREEDGTYIFIQDESSDIILLDKKFGVPITDGAVFVLRK